MKAQVNTWDENAAEELIIKLVQMGVGFEHKQLPSGKIAIRTTAGEDLSSVELEKLYQEALSATEYLRS